MTEEDEKRIKKELQYYISCPNHHNDLENSCTCDEFKKALLPGSGDDWYFPAISIGKTDTDYEIGGVHINFCPWCGKRVQK